jgi:hypothetical protein
MVSYHLTFFKKLCIFKQQLGVLNWLLPVLAEIGRLYARNPWRLKRRT